MPLHGGKAPAWLFGRMKKMAGAITMAIVDQYGPDEMLQRLSDPWWFQAFGCVLGFDWHSSGVTTVTCGALKEASRELGDDLGILVAGGKGGVSRKTPAEIAEQSARLGIENGDNLVGYSKTSAKVDSAAVQDGFTLYHHNFFFTREGRWCVVQQGMNQAEKSARRYHWLGEAVDSFVCEPHAAVSDLNESTHTAVRPHQPDSLLNMVAKEAGDNRSAAVSLVHEHPDRILREIQLMTEGPSLFAPTQHKVLPANINRARLKQMIPRIHEQMPADYQQLLGLEGVGPAAVRSLALIAEIIYQAPVSRRDLVVSPDTAESIRYEENQTATSSSVRRWADYSYAHGGKDKTPFPVDCETYDRNIHLLIQAVRQARMGDSDREHALKRLSEISAE
jgi:hypothetical protein